ncbi:MAG: adenosylcobinamide-GDP ribazoletransferase [Methanophagales archaeon]|nr:adenosylcobinamide-GDP ribazoletransferase [Methanophagales archaeon]
MLDIISFLTQIPVRKETKIEAVAVRSYLFPFVAVLIGLLVAVVAFVSFGFLVSAPEIAALLVLLAIYLVTGLMHLDGLADFFDGIMTSGGRREKRIAMKDEKIGIAGLFAVIFVILLSFFAVETVCAGFTKATTHSFDLPTFYYFASVFIIAEVSAKISMNTCILLGNGKEKGSDAKEGIGALFINSCSKSKYVVALLSSVLIALLFTASSFRFAIMFTGIAVAIVVSYVAKNKFGALSGDIMGASNELARCATLLIWAIFQAAF